MTVSSQAIKLKFPEFTDVDDAAVQFAVEEAAFFVGAVSIPKGGDLAQMYLAAHLIAMGRLSAGTDGLAISSETIGRISIGYRTSGAQAGAIGDLQTTTYGKRYLQILMMNQKSFHVIRTRDQDLQHLRGFLRD
jgi:Protein of unknown function (DUF4054)